MPEFVSFFRRAFVESLRMRRAALSGWLIEPVIHMGHFLTGFFLLAALTMGDMLSAQYAEGFAMGACAGYTAGLAIFELTRDAGSPKLRHMLFILLVQAVSVGGFLLIFFPILFEIAILLLALFIISGVFFS